MIKICLAPGCRNRFVPTNNCHKYCGPCASEFGSASRKRYERRLKEKDPDGRNTYHRVRARKHKANIKRATLSHYGKRGKVVCCWPGCAVNDIDMLSLDHLKDGGKAERETMKHYSGGTAWYQRLKKKGFPTGYQTLCFNHQFKKEILRRRKLHK